jgi:hypothetical protein
VIVTTSNSSFRPKQRLALSRSTRTFPSVRATLQNEFKKSTSYP